MKKDLKAQAYGESSFDIGYLLIVIVLGIQYLIHGKQVNSMALILYGTMALILGIGDSFHLIPRILSHLSNHNPKWDPYLGIGKMITSISMTAMYVVLFYLWKQLYPTVTIIAPLESVVLILAALRILICLFPQNHWITNRDSGKWAMYRNIPFLLLGIIIILMYTYSAYMFQDTLRFLPIAITLSFTFYIPVTLYATKYPMVGMLMIPKTLMYLWIIFMGVSL